MDIDTKILIMKILTFIGVANITFISFFMLYMQIKTRIDRKKFLK